MNVLNLVNEPEQARLEAALAILTLNQHNSVLLERVADALHLNPQESVPLWQVIWENCRLPEECQTIVRTFGIFSQEDLEKLLNRYQSFIAVEKEKTTAEAEEKEALASPDLDFDLLLI